MRSTARRTFLQALAASGLAGCRETGAARPNILFCITDDQSFPHASAYGSTLVRTAAFDRVAREGVLFENAFVSTPSCCPSRGSALAGQDFYRLREASMNHTIWPGGIPIYTDLLGEAGYHVGFTGKGWGPGNWQVSGRDHNPCGPQYNEVKLKPPSTEISPIDYASNFQSFLDARPAGAPFCFWAGMIEPHREFEDGVGIEWSRRLEEIQVPPFLPDAREVRSDLADYAFEIEWQDQQLGRILVLLDERGLLEDTLVVVTSDNGMAFPRAKANLYEYGVHMPLAIRWGARVAPRRVVADFVTFADFAPTFLEAAGLPVPEAMTGRSLMPLLEADGSGQIDPARDAAVFGIERHLPGSRANGAGYPCRGIRTRDFLYIRNLDPHRPPAGDHPGPVWPADDPTGGFGDSDGGPTKTYLWRNREQYRHLYDLAFGPRPAEELYSAADDPANLRNLAGDEDFAGIKRELAQRLDGYLARTGDPRAAGRAEELDAVMRRFPVLGANR
ncbi:MAG: sulfatase [Bryobacterales bacterium]|nr:sulfatase [Bryobacterales bacterium]